jgi:hypothetical protein
MRRSWLAVMLFSLALLVQAFAPAAARIAMARMPTAGAFSLCLQSPGQIGGIPQSPAQRDHQRGACLFCQICCSGISPEARLSSVGKAPVRWTTTFSRTVADRVLPALGQEYSHEARAPPAFS